MGEIANLLKSISTEKEVSNKQINKKKNKEKFNYVEELSVKYNIPRKVKSI